LFQTSHQSIASDTFDKEDRRMKRLLLAVTALGLAGTIGTANAVPDTSSTVQIWNLASVPAGDNNSGAAVQQALPSAAPLIIAAGGTAFLSPNTFVQPINYSLNPGGDNPATILQFFNADTPSAPLPGSCSAACGALTATAPNFASVTLYEFQFRPGTTESFFVTHDDGVSLFADGTALNLLPGESAPTSNMTSPTITLNGGTTYDLWYTSANGTPETLITDTEPVPAPLIGHGLLVLLAVGGVLFGGKLLESRKTHHLQTA
jgi:hypothetical protein